MSAKTKDSPLLRKDADPTQLVTINFVQDGMTAFGRIFYRGQELTIERGSAEWERTLDEEGNSWLEMDEDAQNDRWGERFFRPGKWTGKGFDVADPELTEEERATLLAIEQEKEVKKVPARKRAPGRPPKIAHDPT